jgi:methylenetetrahydrofolate reductase (NADPH)
MRIGDIIDAQDTAVSFEFFPPKTENGSEKLFRTIARLVPLNPSFVSVTYGAGGTTRERTHKLVARLKTETSLTVAAHLTCIGSSRDEIARILDRYDEIGIKNFVALRGDAPDGTRPPAAPFAYGADLVAFIRERLPHVHIGVAGYPDGHPDTPNRLTELDHLKAKVDAGADFIVTQLFFDNRDFFDFCERCELVGIRVPIIAGIMPITSVKGMRRMADLAKGTRFPSGLLRAFQRAQGKEYVERVGIHWAAEQVRDLVHHDVAGVHFFTLNNSTASLRICETLGLRDFSRITGPDVDSIRRKTRSRVFAAMMRATDI